MEETLTIKYYERLVQCLVQDLTVEQHLSNHYSDLLSKCTNLLENIKICNTNSNSPNLENISCLFKCSLEILKQKQSTFNKLNNLLCNRIESILNQYKTIEAHIQEIKSKTSHDQTNMVHKVLLQMAVSQAQQHQHQASKQLNVQQQQQQQQQQQHGQMLVSSQNQYHDQQTLQLFPTPITATARILPVNIVLVKCGSNCENKQLQDTKQQTKQISNFPSNVANLQRNRVSDVSGISSKRTSINSTDWISMSHKQGMSNMHMNGLSGIGNINNATNTNCITNGGIKNMNQININGFGSSMSMVGHGIDNTPLASINNLNSNSPQLQCHHQTKKPCGVELQRPPQQQQEQKHILHGSTNIFTADTTSTSTANKPATLGKVDTLSTLGAAGTIHRATARRITMFNDGNHETNVCEYKYKCDICGKRYKVARNFRLHVGIHQGLGFKCRFCQKIFPRRQNVQEHERIQFCVLFIVVVVYICVTLTKG